MALPTWWYPSFGARQCREHARPLPWPAEQDVHQLGRTSIQTGSDRLQGNDFQGRNLGALVTPLVTKFGRHIQPTEH